MQVPPKAYLNFLFSLQGADSSKQGDDLVIELPDGSKVVCLGYYSNTAEGDRPQIAVNGEALPPSALDVQFFNQQVEGLRLDGDPQGSEQGEQGAQNAGEVAGQEAGAGDKGPASSGATATGESLAQGRGKVPNRVLDRPQAKADKRQDKVPLPPTLAATLATLAMKAASSWTIMWIFWAASTACPALI